MKEIVIVGTGQVGSRHLQGLSLLPSPANIYCVDLSPESRELARRRWESVQTERHHVSYFESITDLPVSEIDLGIIATTSPHRWDVFETLIDAVDIEYVIFEKILFQQFEAYESVQKTLDDNGISAWVNCARRSQDVYQRIKQEFTGRPIDIEVIGNDWALASNGIHFVDLFSWLTDSAEMEWDRSLLENKIYQNKRDGFKEVMGRLTATNGESTLTLRAFDAPETNPAVRISGPTQQWNIWEDQELLIQQSFSDDSGISMEQSEIALEYQSELTGLVADAIFQGGTCSLTGFTESSRYHIPYLETIRNHINDVESNQWDICPIT
jgi:hypothetical protein